MNFLRRFLEWLLKKFWGVSFDVPQIAGESQPEDPSTECPRCDKPYPLKDTIHHPKRMPGEVTYRYVCGSCAEEMK